MMSLPPNDAALSTTGPSADQASAGRVGEDPEAGQRREGAGDVAAVGAGPAAGRRRTRRPGLETPRPRRRDGLVRGDPGLASGRYPRHVPRELGRGGLRRGSDDDALGRLRPPRPPACGRASRPRSRSWRAMPSAGQLADDQDPGHQMSLRSARNSTTWRAASWRGLADDARGGTRLGRSVIR